MLKVLTMALCGLLAAPLAVAAMSQVEHGERGARDPFIPLVLPDGSFYFEEEVEMPEVSLEDFQLEGIVGDPSGGEAFALINGEVLREGEAIEGLQILEIRRDSVVLLTGQGEVVVQLVE